MRRALLLGLVVVLGLLGPGGGVALPPAAEGAGAELQVAQSASGPGTRAVDLAAGWNLVGWTAAATPAAAVAGSLTGVLESLHTF